MSDLPSSFGKEIPNEPPLSSFPPPIVAGTRKTEAQFLEELRVLQTNFLFLFGDSQSGKSAICASLIYYMMTHPDIGKFTDRVQHSDSGPDFIRRAIGKISQKRFLERTPGETVTLAGGRFEPTDKRFPSTPITFREMAGEELRNLVAPTGVQSFPQHIDVFLNEKDLNLLFVLVIRHSTVSHEKDLMLVDFIDYLRRKDARFVTSNILLLISQWDTYSGDMTTEEFVKTFLPLTYAALSHRDSAITTYSVGEVSVVDGEPYISKLDSESPARLIRWIYKSVTGDDLMRPSMFARFLRLIK